jgi:hypothetical protein
MWRDIFGFAGAAIAVINGFVAFFAALLPVRRSVLKLRLGVAAAVLGIAALGTTLVARYTIHVQEERQLADRREVRERLEALIADGRAILAQIRDQQKTLPNREADEWAQRAEVFLHDRFGELYVARYRSEVGDMYGEPVLPAGRLAYWRAVRNRLVNLEAIAAELPPPWRQSLVTTPKL